MNYEDKEILEFIRSFKGSYVSVVEVSRKVGARRKFNLDRAWARPVLLRMEMEGLVESNEYGEFRTRASSEDTTFIEAIKQPNPKVSLGETTIICIDDVIDEEESEPPNLKSNQM